MQLTICEKIVDEAKFLETHELRAKIAIEAELLKCNSIKRKSEHDGKLEKVW